MAFEVSVLFLRQNHDKETGRTYLVIVESYREKGRKNPTTKTVQSIGYLDELKEKYEDPVAHFKELAKKMTEENKTTIEVNLNEQLQPDIAGRMNLGYATIVKIFYELNLQKFFQNRQRHKSFEYNAASIMLLLVVSRLLSPASKKRTFEDRTQYFERFGFELHHVYRSLTFFAGLDTQAQRHIHNQINEYYGRNTECVYYDVTNYYFEVDKEDELRKKGVSKEHRPDPIIQMGLAMDADGIPIAYKLYPGNTNDVLTLRPILGELKIEYDLGRVIVVADKGINSGDNIYYLTTDNDKDGYVISLSVRGSSEAFKKYVLESAGYQPYPSGTNEGKSESGDACKVKSRVDVRYIKVTKTDGKKMTKPVNERQVIIYSKKYADRAKADRVEAVRKARDMCANPSRYNRATSYGAVKYVRNVSYDKETGEILTDEGHCPVFDESKLAEEEKYDGYYAIVTSEMGRSVDWIIKTYRGLWEIEESFKITKSELETRPVYVSRKDHIQAHFLSCFIALVIARLLEKKTNYVYPLARLLDAIRSIACSIEDKNLYLFDYRNEVSDAIGKVFGIDFTRRRLQLNQIKKILSECKK
jgi:transposase